MICDYEINFLHVYRYKTVCKITSNILLLTRQDTAREKSATKCDLLVIEL